MSAELHSSKVQLNKTATYQDLVIDSVKEGCRWFAERAGKD